MLVPSAILGALLPAPLKSPNDWATTSPPHHHQAEKKDMDVKHIMKWTLQPYRFRAPTTAQINRRMSLPWFQPRIRTLRADQSRYSRRCWFKDSIPYSSHKFFFYPVVPSLGKNQSHQFINVIPSCCSHQQSSPIQQTELKLAPSGTSQQNSFTFIYDIQENDIVQPYSVPDRDS